MNMYNDRMEHLINAALADGELTEKEKQILFRNAQAEGIDLDEFEMVLESRLYEKQKQDRDAAAAQAQAQALALAQAQAQSQAQSAQQAAPKSTKFGDIRKCPACGAIVAAGSASCAECGYAYTEDMSTCAIDKLYERLSAIEEKYQKMSNGEKIFGMFTGANPQIDKAKEKINAITVFNVPNTRAELLGLLSSLQPIVDPKGPKNGMNKFSYDLENLGYGYWVLFTNCINKAKMSFASDKTFAPYFAFYEQKAGEVKGSGGLFSMFKK